MPPAAHDLARALRVPRTEREHVALAALDELAAGGATFDRRGSGILRSGSAVLVGLPADELVVRVDDRTPRSRAERQVTVARLLDRLDVPAIRLGGPDDQPVIVAGASVTWWRWARPSGEGAGPADLGALIRRLRAVSVGLDPAGVPRADPLDAVGEILERSRAAGLLDEDDEALLHSEAERLGPPWRSLAAEEPVLVHGDLHVDNVVVTAEGPLLADLELSGLGPAAYDLAPTAVAVRRHGTDPAVLDALVAAVGDPAPPPEPLVEVDELWATAWAVETRTQSADHEAEARRRLARWRDPSAAGERWVLR